MVVVLWTCFGRWRGSRKGKGRKKSQEQGRRMEKIAFILNNSVTTCLKCVCGCVTWSNHEATRADGHTAVSSHTRTPTNTQEGSAKLTTGHFCVIYWSFSNLSCSSVHPILAFPCVAFSCKHFILNMICVCGTYWLHGFPLERWGWDDCLVQQVRKYTVVASQLTTVAAAVTLVVDAGAVVAVAAAAV